jgi:AP-1-like factor
MYVYVLLSVIDSNKRPQLEDKVSELEAKNAGNEFENENLRQLLSKLQQENMALKTSAFTFSMPMPGANQSPVGSVQGTSPDPVQQRAKPPTPPGPQPLQHRGESTSSSASAASNTVRSASGGSGSISRSPTESSTASASVSPFGNGGPRASAVFHPERYNAFASSAAPAARQLSPNAGQQAAAGFAQFGQTQAQGPVQDVGMSSSAGPTGASNEMDWQSLLNNNFTMLAQAPEFMSFSDDAAFGNFGGYSDIWPGFSGVDAGMAGIESTLATSGNQFNTIHNKPVSTEDAMLNTMAEDNMEEFLRSLGAGQTPAAGAAADDVFDMNFGNPSADNNDMLRSYVDSTAYKNASGPSSASAHSSVLSPSNFFTTSPEASSASSVPSEGKHASQSASPQASESSNTGQAFRIGTFGSRPEDAVERGATMLKRDGTVVPCSKVFEEVTQRIPVSTVTIISRSRIDPLCRSTADSI